MPGQKHNILSEAKGQLEASVRPIAEVTASTITGLQAECFPIKGQQPDLPPKPRFGSFLKVESQAYELYAVVHNVVTGPQDSVHKPSALGLTREELRVQQPQIFSLLKTEVHALLIGYGMNGRIHQHLPPHPADVHDFVYAAQPEEIAALTEDFEFLRLLFSVSDIPADELIAATIREAHLALGRDNQFLLDAGRVLSTMLRADYDRLLSILKKIKPS